MFHYQYLVGCSILSIFWIIGFILRKDLRKPMVISGIMYAVITISLFLFWKLFSRYFYLGAPLIPSYWNPNTLFDLGRETGGFSLEDIIFMFLVGGISAYIYELTFRRKIGRRKYKNHISALLISLFAALLIQGIFVFNVIYMIIAAGLFGSVIIWIGRKDLIRNSIFGGLIFAIVYLCSFLLFNAFFPHFIEGAFVLKGTLGIFVFGVPIEELLYALSFGLFWVPMYEYLFGLGDVKAA